MSDPVREYLESQGYSPRTVENGLRGLVEDWERVVLSVTSEELQHQYDYLNDMDGRRILIEALAVAPATERMKWADRVRMADEQILPHLVPTKECLWGTQRAAERGYSREQDWWYYHRPKTVDSSWDLF